MRLRENHRVPLLLLACFVTALMFPRACSETRVGVGSLVPATATLTAAETRDPGAALREENARLRDEVARFEDDLEARLHSADGPLAGVRFVRASAGRERIAVSARVRHRDVSATGRSFLIDAGRADGIREGLPVVWGGSLVGVVVTATEHAARVVRIDDPSPRSVVPATILPAGDAARSRRAPGVSRGNGDGGTSVSFLRPGDAKPGDAAVTGVGDALIPEGLVLGEVVAFSDDDRNGSWEAEVRPLRDLDTVDSVVVLLAPADAGPALREAGRK